MDSNDSQRIYDVFLQTQAIAFNVLKCFSSVLECFSNVVQCIGNASKHFFLSIKLVPEVQPKMRKIIIDD